MSHAFTLGFGLGFLVALQLGPVSLYQIKTTLRNGLAVGLAFAAGIALVDLAYAALGALGVAPLLTVGPLETILGLVGAAVLSSWRADATERVPRAPGRRGAGHEAEARVRACAL